MTRNVKDGNMPAVDVRCCTCQTRSRIRPKSASDSGPDEGLAPDVFEDLRAVAEGYRLAWYCRHCRTATEHAVVRLPRNALPKRAANRTTR